jgi:hypothetical protein
MDRDELRENVWRFLVIGTFFWSLRLMYVYGALADSILMLLVSLIVYKNKAEK